MNKENSQDYSIALNKNHISGRDETATIMSGDPISFFGIGLVVFIDLLGFSKKIIDNWSEERNSPLNRLIRIKNSPIISSRENQIKFGVYSADNNGRPIYHHYYRCRVQTLSDSIVVSTALPANLNAEDFMLAFLVAANASLDIWCASLMEGFTIRGGLELDDVFWNSSEIVGPAFIRAYQLENFAKTSRIIVGERFLATLLFIWENVHRLEYPINVEDSILTLLMKSPDGYISINPKYILYRKNVNARNLIDKVRMLQSLCRIDRHRLKYDDLISLLSEPKKFGKPNKQDLVYYQSILRQQSKSSKENGDCL